MREQKFELVDGERTRKGKGEGLREKTGRRREKKKGRGHLKGLGR